ncbi:amidase [Bauldia litoralis]|uniref:Indoleacetamide hydrolase n=1 Tax=Bauldia litoralis TaxID=665467 RepID=A0A1G6D6C7_9HYPH|nr:amidase [Bauldia litoralis]SDB40726.1 aspartyl-tRNA(Asn)/glutamyl-tRNA(Gln) amidotransferase subunit A [Bauldia litoralis]
MTMPDSDTQLCFLPATELAARIRRRDLSPVEVTEAYLRRIEARNPLVNAYSLILADRAMDAARAAEKAVMAGGPLGALHGVPVGIKDLDDVAGVPTSMGSNAVMNRVPAKSSLAVERLLDAGAIVLGKTNAPEFGHKGTTDNLRFGPTSTPWAIGYNAGGSSGGSAAAVADGMAALAQGTDGGGSVRIPASFSGTVGFKASFGRIPSVTRPDAFLWGHPLVHIGPLARTVADAALMTAVMAGPHPRDPLSLPDTGIDYVAAAERPSRAPRIAFSPRLGNFPVDARVAAVVRDAVSFIQAQDIAVDEVELDFGVDHNELAALWVRTIGVHYAAIAVHWKGEGIDLLGDHADRLTPEFRRMLEDAVGVSAVDHALDDLLRTRILDGLEDVFEDHDLIVAPTLAVPPVRNATDGNTIGPTEINGEPVDPLIGWCMTYPVNFTGHPAISVPAGLTPEGLPVGLQIIGRRHDDESVLAMAARFERMQPWFQDYPGLAQADRAA